MFVEHKLHTSCSDQQVFYNHPFESSVCLNDWVGSLVSLSYSGQKRCVGCKKIVKKLQQGYCFPCSRKLACCDLCILKPSLCHYHLGTCREPDWGLKYCFDEHVLYLSQTSHLKVGLTRISQIPTRWIDQGAQRASILLVLPHRRLAGLMEEELTAYCRDKTNWRDLLTGRVDSTECFEEKFYELSRIIESSALFEQSETPLTLSPFSPQNFLYPVEQYLAVAKSLNLEKHPFFQERLLGIKGQYLLFESGGVNLRKYLGYDIMLEKVT